MRISVIVPAYNAEKFIAATIAGVQAQTVGDWELIVVDDGSTDGTLAVARSCAKKDARIRVLHHANRGLAETRNAGYAVSSMETEFVAFLDADDIWEPDALESLMGVLLREPDKMAVYGLGRFIDAEGRPLAPGEMEAFFRIRHAIQDGKLVDWPLDRPTTFAVEVVRNYIPTSGCALIRRVILEKVGLYDARLCSAEDWDLWLRISHQGDIAFLNRVVLQYRQHEGNMSKKSKVMADGELFLRKKLLSNPALTPEEREMAVLGYRHRSRQILGYRLEWAKGFLQKGQVVPAAKQLRHAMQNYLLWRLGPRWDRGAQG